MREATSGSGGRQQKVKALITTLPGPHEEEERGKFCNSPTLKKKKNGNENTN